MDHENENELLPVCDDTLPTPWGSMMVGTHQNGAHAYVAIGELHGDGEYIHGIGDTWGLLVWTNSLVDEAKAVAGEARTYTEMRWLLVVGRLDNNSNLPPQPWRDEQAEQ